MGALIRYGLDDCRLGRLLVAGTNQGICMVALGDHDCALITAISERYPKEKATLDEAAVAEWIDALQRYLHNGALLPSLPLDITGTLFQWSVWRALCSIPPGATCTYSELANLVGAPNACRAVGRACGANPVAMIIPCHRVTRRNGELGGYRWGAQRKAALLQWEREHMAKDS